MSTRAGSVSSRSSSSRQARLKRAEAREPSGAAGLSAGAGTGARARQGESCAASSAPPCLSIAPQGLPPLCPEGRGCGTGWGYSSCSYSPPWGAIGSPSAGDLGAPGLQEPGRRDPERVTGSGVRKPMMPRRARGLGCAARARGAVSGGPRRGVGLRAECADSPSGRGLSLDGTGRGRGRGHARPSGRLRPRSPGAPLCPRCGGRLRP